MKKPASIVAYNRPKLSIRLKTIPNLNFCSIILAHRGTYVWWLCLQYVQIVQFFWQSETSNSKNILCVAFHMCLIMYNLKRKKRAPICYKLSGWFVLRHKFGHFSPDYFANISYCVEPFIFLSKCWHFSVHN